VPPLIHRPVTSWRGPPVSRPLWRDEPHRREGAHDLCSGPLTGGVMLLGTGFSRACEGRSISTSAVVTHHRTPPEALATISRPAKSARELSSRTGGGLYLCDALLEGLARNSQSVAAARRPCIRPAHPLVRQRHLPRHRRPAPADQPHSRARVMGARHGRVVTHAVQSPVRPATRGMCAVSMASARIIGGRMGVGRRSSMDVLAFAGLSDR
jgi:hypothetical protein